jgi:hypothetical protein
VVGADKVCFSLKSAQQPWTRETSLGYVSLALKAIPMPCIQKTVVRVSEAKDPFASQRAEWEATGNGAGNEVLNPAQAKTDVEQTPKVASNLLTNFPVDGSNRAFFLVLTRCWRPVGQGILKIKECNDVVFLSIFPIHAIILGVHYHRGIGHRLDRNLVLLPAQPSNQQRSHLLSRHGNPYQRYNFGANWLVCGVNRPQRGNQWAGSWYDGSSRHHSDRNKSAGSSDDNADWAVYRCSRGKTHRKWNQHPDCCSVGQAFQPDFAS